MRRGTVIDHIPSRALFKAVRLLGLDKCENAITVGCNLPSGSLGTKGIIKVSGLHLKAAELGRIAVIAPGATVNTIDEYEVTDKQRVELPETLTGVVRCANPKCITNNEPMPTRFITVEATAPTLRCAYCEHECTGDDIELL